MSNHAKLVCNPGITAQAVWRLLQLLQQQHLNPQGKHPLPGLFSCFFFF
ncbi:hypothetical protein [Cardiobacterium hominis]